MRLWPLYRRWESVPATSWRQIRLGLWSIILIQNKTPFRCFSYLNTLLWKQGLRILPTILRFSFFAITILSIRKYSGPSFSCKMRTWKMNKSFETKMCNSDHVTWSTCRQVIFASSRFRIFLLTQNRDFISMCTSGKKKKTLLARKPFIAISHERN